MYGERNRSPPRLFTSLKMLVIGPTSSEAAGCILLRWLPSIWNFVAIVDAATPVARTEVRDA